jgi:hypothetical protein
VGLDVAEARPGQVEPLPAADGQAAHAVGDGDEAEREADRGDRELARN